MAQAPLRVGLLGYGIAGRVFHAPLIAATPGLRLDAIVTARPGAPGAGRASSTPDARLRRRRRRSCGHAADTLDLVVVATPNRQHAPMARAALAAGLPVVVDKPLAPDRRAVPRAGRRGGRPGGAADRVPEPPLGRRLPDRPPAGRGRRAGAGDPLRVPLRALAADDQAGLAGERRTRRRPAARCSTSAPTWSTRRCSCSARSSGSTRRWTAGGPAPRSTTTRSSR